MQFFEISYLQGFPGKSIKAPSFVKASFPVTADNEIHPTLQ
jgi:hypothetical protein